MYWIPTIKKHQLKEIPLSPDLQALNRTHHISLIRIRGRTRTHFSSKNLVLQPYFFKTHGSYE